MRRRPERLIALLLTFGAPAFAQTTVLDSSADVILSGDQATATFGMHVAPAGDVDGDGYDDVLIGDPSYDGAFVDSGRITLHRGSETGPSPVPDWSLEGAGSGARLNQAFAAGDVKGDGYDDVVVRRGGDVVLYAGSGDGLSGSAVWSMPGFFAGHGDVNGDGFDDLGISDLTTLSLFPGSTSGPSTTPSETISPLGGVAFEDVNGDGYSDLAMSFRTCGNCAKLVGALLVRLGSPKGLGKLVKRHIDLVYETAVPSLIAAGDVDGDGFGDLAVTLDVDLTVNVDQCASLLLFYGTRSGIVSQPDRALLFSQGRMGLAPIRAAGDVDGDGFADLLVHDYDPVPGAGRVLAIYDGSAGGVVTTPTLRIRPAQATSRFAMASAAAGDVNADGYGDFIFSAPELGSVYVFHGKPTY